MRALIIDPFKREIREIDDDLAYQGLKEYLAQGARGPKTVFMASGPRLAPNIWTWVDDEGYYRPDQAWFWIKGYGAPLAGYCIVLGMTEEGENADLPATVTVDRMRAIVLWTTPDEAEAAAPPVTVSSGPTLDQMRVTSETPIDFTDKRPIT